MCSITEEINSKPGTLLYRPSSAGLQHPVLDQLLLQPLQGRPLDDDDEYIEGA